MPRMDFALSVYGGASLTEDETKATAEGRARIFERRAGAAVMAAFRAVAALSSMQPLADVEWKDAGFSADAGSLANECGGRWLAKIPRSLAGIPLGATEVGPDPSRFRGGLAVRFRAVASAGILPRTGDEVAELLGFGGQMTEDGRVSAELELWRFPEPDDPDGELRECFCDPDSGNEFSDWTPGCCFVPDRFSPETRAAFARLVLGSPEAAARRGAEIMAERKRRENEEARRALGIS